MKKHFVFALIAAIIMSNCFPAATFAQEIGSPPGGTEIFAEASDAETEEAKAPDELLEETAAPNAEIEEATVPDAVIEEAEAPDAEAEDETPDAAAEQAAAGDDVVEEAETPDADTEVVHESEEIADSEELVGEPSGDCGANATWEIFGDRLTISGEGAIYDYQTSTAPWYSRRSEIRTILIGDGITQIGSYAFANLTNLLGVSMPSSLKKLGNGAFYNCTSLPAIEIPSGVTYIDTAALGKCTSLANVSFLGRAPSIQHMAFTNVTATVYYLSSSTTWTPNNKIQYGGMLTWKPASIFYDVWVHGIRVNSSNNSDIMGDGGNVAYTPSTKTLKLFQTNKPMGLTVSRDYHRCSASIYAIGDLEIQGVMTLYVEADDNIFVTGKLTINESDTLMDSVYADEFVAKHTRVRINAITANDVTLDSCEVTATRITCLNDTLIDNCFLQMLFVDAEYCIECSSCTIKDSYARIENETGTAIASFMTFTASNSEITALGKIAGIYSPRIKIQGGNTIHAEGTAGAIFGGEDVMSQKIEVAPGYVFHSPESPQIGPYGIMEKGKFATYVFMEPLKTTDKCGLYRANKAVTSITIPTKSLTQLELRTKDGYFVTGTWSSKNPSIASVSNTGLVAAMKYGKTKIACKAGSTTLTCDVQTRFFDVNNPAQAGFRQIYWGVDKGIIAGFDGGVYFGPDLSCTRLQFAVMMWRAKGKPKASGTLPFKDTKNLKPNTDSYKAILWASKNGIVKGYSDNTFRPNNKITRESIVIILWRMAGKPTARKALAFKDTRKLSTTATAYRAIAWASEKGIVKGYTDNTFRKDDYCKRFQCIIMIYRFVNR